MPLPVKQAADLAQDMAKKGLYGSIMMSKKEPMEESPEDDKSGDYDSELDSCIDDVADALMSGEKDKLVMSLHNLVDCLKQDDESQDEEMMG